MGFAVKTCAELVIMMKVMMTIMLMMILMVMGVIVMIVAAAAVVLVLMMMTMIHYSHPHHPHRLIILIFLIFLIIITTHHHQVQAANDSPVPDPDPGRQGKMTYNMSCPLLCFEVSMVTWTCRGLLSRLDASLCCS